MRCSQRRSDLIAASDSVKIQFSLRHRGALHAQPPGSFTSLSEDTSVRLGLNMLAAAFTLRDSALSFFDLWFYVSLGRGSISFATLRGKLQLRATLAVQPHSVNIPFMELLLERNISTWLLPPVVAL